jgi:DNA-binding beta-propeller fold protein YncE
VTSQPPQNRDIQIDRTVSSRRLGAACVCLALAWLPGARAELVVSANDSKLTLTNGLPLVVQSPPPDTVSVIDLGVGRPAVLGHVQVPTSVVGPPTSVAVTPDESIALVTAGAKIDPTDPTRLAADNRLSIIDLRARPPVVLGQAQAGSGAAGVSVTRDGRLALVANRNEGTVSVFRIEGSALHKLDTVPVGGPDSGPSHVAIAPDGRSALVTRDGDHTISLLAIDGDKVSYTHHDLGVGLKPYGVVITPDGQEAVVANLGLGRGDNDTISLIDLTLKPPRSVETYTVGQTPEGIAMSPDGKLVAVVVMNGSSKPKESPFYSPVGRVLLFRMNRGSLTRVADAAVGAWPQGAVFSADGRTLLVQSMIERSIAVFAIEPGYRLRDTGHRILLPGGAAALRTAERPARGR